MLDGTSALVAGGASGLGEATAAALTAAGASVVIFDRDEPAGPVGRLRICVICAGVGGGGMVLDHTGRPHDLGLFERTVRVNLVGTFNVISLAAAAMIPNQPDHDGERGVIVTTSSIAAFDGQGRGVSPRRLEGRGRRPHLAGGAGPGPVGSPSRGCRHTSHSTVRNRPASVRSGIAPSGYSQSMWAIRSASSTRYRDRSRSTNIDGREHAVQRNRSRHMVGTRTASAFLRPRPP